ncbi:MAG: SIS domain-containing protein, partial [Gemmatimonadaceae bacterium]
MTPGVALGAGTLSGTTDAGALAACVDALLDRRTRATELFFSAEADRIARLCHRIAERFARGGRLIAFGYSPAARSDARHVAVEFVHPVIVGKRALPALAVTREAGPLAAQIDLLVLPDDIVIAFGGETTSDHDSDHDGAKDTRDAVTVARRRGCLTVAFAPVGAEWELQPPSDDPFMRQELAETLYHILWELVHVFFDHRGLLDGAAARPVHDVGASSFLYPFLASKEHDLDAVIADVRSSVMLKANEVSELRRLTLEGGRDVLINAARALRASLDAGGTLIAFGNGGSATDAMDVVADFRAAPQGWPGRRALDLTEDTAIITAIANDIGTDAIFSRQIIAYARQGDFVLALSTSGNSRNIIQALAEARARGLTTMALV